MADIRNRDLGEIYTPKCVSDMLRKQVEEVLPGFEKKFLIWDSCWGEGNLTRPLEADDLWCSTLRQQDIEDNNSEKGKKFVYDFLNDDCDILKSIQAMWGAQYNNLPEHIVECLTGYKHSKIESDFDDEFGFDDSDEDSELSLIETDTKPILFYINPPYASQSVFGANNTDSRDSTDNVMRSIMNDDKVGTSSSQAYMQFMYRILKMKRMYKNKDIYVALVSPQNYLSTDSCAGFRHEWLKDFKLMSGTLFQANTFAGLSPRWGITTTVWGPCERLGENTETDKREFKCKLMKRNDDVMVQYGTKTLYNIDGLRKANEIAKEKLLDSNAVEAVVTCSSGAVRSNKKKVLWDKDALGYMFFKGNNVYHNVTEIGLMSVPYGDGSGASITKDNVMDILAFFASKGTVGVYGKVYSQDKDESIYPDKTHPDWVRLQTNAVLYSLFNDNTAFCEIDFGADHVVNNFNYLNPNKIGYKLLHDALNSGLILDSGIRMYNKSEEVRKFIENDRVKGGEFDREHPEYQVWQEEAGYYQWKWILKFKYPELYKEWRQIYREYSDELKQLVYNVGFYKNRAVDLNGNYIE